MSAKFIGATRAGCSQPKSEQRSNLGHSWENAEGNDCAQFQSVPVEWQLAEIQQPKETLLIGFTCARTGWTHSVTADDMVGIASVIDTVKVAKVFVAIQIDGSE
jgi:hypothetical protein